ncbi:DNA-directed RNA polymerase subunit delta [Allobacillus sp. GCM10007491]|uniref:Probable DNA-directed RNA polymerase subunit delta n=1 Tax=Allobacillus saliphilus TaxID=2912308 RepID=A0A941CVQ0_9BACI|nr:DNA-directed RNA polymerase subunit delta [Allobacillus saliphilus]MBR7554069.1 DNA-directed RNA polymerase subunit delta [Allobacillus saliphilus]
MGLEKYANEDIREVSMIEIAYEYLQDENQSVSFSDLYNKIAEEKEMTEEDKKKFISQFYTDLNVDGRFIPVGSNVWGLKQWYPFDKTEEDIIKLEEVERPKRKKKKRKKSDTDTIDDEPEEDYLKEDLQDVDAGFSEEDDGNLFGQAEEESEDEFFDEDEEVEDFDEEDEEEK